MDPPTQPPPRLSKRPRIDLSNNHADTDVDLEHELEQMIDTEAFACVAYRGSSDSSRAHGASLLPDGAGDAGDASLLPDGVGDAADASTHPNGAGDAEGADGEVVDVESQSDKTEDGDVDIIRHEKIAVLQKFCLVIGAKNNNIPMDAYSADLKRDLESMEFEATMLQSYLEAFDMPNPPTDYPAVSLRSLLGKWKKVKPIVNRMTMS